VIRFRWDIPVWKTGRGLGEKEETTIQSLWELNRGYANVRRYRLDDSPGREGKSEQEGSGGKKGGLWGGGKLQEKEGAGKPSLTLLSPVE